MAINWTFDEKDVKENEFGVLPEGDYRVRIEKVTEKVSKSGNDMLEIEFAVSGVSSKLWFYLVFTKENSQMTNTRLAQIFDSFDIPKSMNFQTWVGKVGAVHVKHDEYNGNKSAKVHYFIKRDKQAALPSWVEGNASVTNAQTPVINVAEADLPF